MNTDTWTNSRTPLTFEACTDDSALTVRVCGMVDTRRWQYRTGKAGAEEQWSEWKHCQAGQTVSMDRGDRVQMKGCSYTAFSCRDFLNIVSTGKVRAYGNLMSLRVGDNEDSLEHADRRPLANFAFMALFQDNTGLADASNLVMPHRQMACGCYMNMFQGCTRLVTAPELPATNVADSCYFGMFSECERLIKAPALPAVRLAMFCYANMFSGCKALCYVSCAATNIKADEATSNWLIGVSTLGLFYRQAVTPWEKGWSGIPRLWRVMDMVTSDSTLINMLCN